MVLSLETVDFFPNKANPSPLRLIKDCSGSSVFVSFWMGANQQLCFDLDFERNFPPKIDKRKRRSVATDLLEKTKYSLVANTSNYDNFAKSVADSMVDVLTSGGPLELVSSGNKLAVRFFAKQGQLPGRGLRAKFKIGKTLLLVFMNRQ